MAAQYNTSACLCQATRPDSLDFDEATPACKTCAPAGADHNGTAVRGGAAMRFVGCTCGQTLMRAEQAARSNIVTLGGN
jgi:hypothetical protein